MRSFVALVAVFITACSSGDDGEAGVDGGGECPIADVTPDTGSLTALFAQRCNVANSMGQRKWYRIAATLPGSNDVIQIELYDQAGAFEGTAVHAGTFPVDTDFATCGVCLRAQGDKGTATTKEYFGTGGMVTVTAVGAAGTDFTASVADATFAEVNAVSHVAIPGGCSSDVASASLTGTMVDHGGTGGGGGGGGGGGTGTCAATVGDAEPI